MYINGAGLLNAVFDKELPHSGYCLTVIKSYLKVIAGFPGGVIVH